MKAIKIITYSLLLHCFAFSAKGQNPDNFHMGANDSLSVEDLVNLPIFLAKIMYNSGYVKKYIHESYTLYGDSADADLYHGYGEIMVNHVSNCDSTFINTVPFAKTMHHIKTITAIEKFKNPDFQVASVTNFDGYSSMEKKAYTNSIMSFANIAQFKALTSSDVSIINIDTTMLSKTLASSIHLESRISKSAVEVNHEIKRLEELIRNGNHEVHGQIVFLRKVLHFLNENRNVVINSNDLKIVEQSSIYQNLKSIIDELKGVSQNIPQVASLKDIENLTTTTYEIAKLAGFHNKDAEKALKTLSELVLHEDKLKEIVSKISKGEMDINDIPNHIKLGKDAQKAFEVYKHGEAIFGEIKNINFNSEGNIDWTPQTLQSLSTIATQTTSLLQTAGMKGEDLEKTAQLINYAATAVNLTASIYTGNYVGALSTGLNAFGGSKKSEPSAELKAIWALQQQMQKEFGNLNAKIDINHIKVMDAIGVLNSNIASVSKSIYESNKLINNNIFEVAKHQDKRFDRIDSSLSVIYEFVVTAFNWQINRESIYNMYVFNKGKNPVRYKEYYDNLMNPTYHINYRLITDKIMESRIFKIVTEHNNGVPSQDVLNILLQFNAAQSQFVANIPLEIQATSLSYPSVSLKNNMDRYMYSYLNGDSKLSFDFPQNALPDFNINHEVLKYYYTIYLKYAPVYLTFKIGEGVQPHSASELKNYLKSEAFEDLSLRENFKVALINHIIPNLDRAISKLSLESGTLLYPLISTMLDVNHPSYNSTTAEILLRLPYLEHNFLVFMLAQDWSSVIRISSYEEFKVKYDRAYPAATFPSQRKIKISEIERSFNVRPAAEAVYFQNKLFPNDLYELVGLRDLALQYLYEIDAINHRKVLIEQLKSHDNPKFLNLFYADFYNSLVN